MKLFKRKLFNKGNPSREKNIFEIFNIVLTLCLIGGMSTVWYNRTKKRLEFSKILTIFAIALLIFTCYHTSLIPKVVLHIERGTWKKNITLLQMYEMVTSQQYIMKLINPLIITVVAILSRFVLIFSVKFRLPKIVETLNEVDDILKDSKIILQKNLKMLWLMLSFFVLLSIPFQVYSIFKAGVESFEVTGTFIILLYNNISTSCVEFQFICICYFIYSRFKFINKSLSQMAVMVNQGSYSDDISKHILFRKQETKNISAISSKTNSYALTQTKIAPEDVMTLKIAHRKLSRILVKANHLYNVQLLISLCACVSNILINLYYSIYGEFRATSSKTEAAIQPIGSILGSVTWALFYLQRFIMICCAASFVTNEGNATKSFVADVFDRELEENSRKELKYFFLYAMARDGSLSVCGLFILDIRILTTAAATGITYLVILAQFHNN